MEEHTMSKPMRLGLIAAVCAGLAGCAEERDPRSYVQPNIFRKADLQGEWWHRSTVVDVPAHVRGVGFKGAQNYNIERVWFDLQEDVAYARRAYEWVDGTEEQENGPGFAGAIVGAWKVEHFDIIRDYNPSTGEETNRIIESEERPWYMREFVRIDWSENLAENPLRDLILLSAEAKTTSVSYWQSDPTQEDALHIELRPRMDANRDPVDEDGNGEGDMEVGYFDVVNRYIIEPVEGTPFPDVEAAPLCLWNWQLELLDCASQETSVRHSFWRIPQDHEYQPQPYTMTKHERFGFFLTERRSYNRQYTYTQSGVRFFVNRFNLFERWFQREDDAGTPDDPMDDRGPVVMDEQGVPVLLPMSARMNAVKPVVYFISPTMPEDLWGSAQHTIDEWDFAIRRLLAGWLTMSEKTDTAAVPESEIEARADGLERVVFLCHNPVRAGDPAECMEERRCTAEQVANAECRVRNGDLRFSVLWWVDEPGASSPGGYGPPSADPLTGETISANAYIYGWAMDRAAAIVRDIVKLLNGDISALSFAEGDNVRAWVEDFREGNHDRMPVYSDHEVRAMVGATTRGFGEDIAPARPVDLYQTGQLERLFREHGKRILDSGVLGKGWNEVPARLEQIRDTALEDKLISQPELLLQAGYPPDAAEAVLFDKSARRRVSPLTRNTINRYVQKEIQRLGSRGVCLSLFDDNAYLRLAKLYEKAFAGMKADERDERIRIDARKWIFQAYADHEVGHNMGLRHNFEGSIDALNYFPEYWELRAMDGTMEPRYADPITKEELEQGIYEYQYASVMDYTARYAGDIHGLGKYDHAALAFGWGGLVEAFSSEGQHCGRLGAVQLMSAWNTPSPFVEFSSGGAIHYTDYPNVIRGAGSSVSSIHVLEERVIGLYDEQAASDVGLDPANAPVMKRMCSLWNLSNQTCQNVSCETDEDCELYQPSAPRCDQLTKRCGAGAFWDKDQPGEEGYGRYDAAHNDECDALEIDGFLATTREGENYVQLRVPYRFCSDEFAGANINCRRFDQGGDVFESMQNDISTYRNYYLFNNWKRDRWGWSPSYTEAYDSYIYNRYHDPFANVLKYYVLYRTFYESLGVPREFLDDFFSGLHGWGVFTAAAVDGFRTLTEFITMPEPGTYELATVQGTGGPATVWTPCSESLRSTCADPDPLRISILDGRYLSSTWDFDSEECGYEWFNCQKRVGIMVDKSLALFVLGDATANFVGQDTSEDTRQYAINYYKAFKPQLLELFGAILTGDTPELAPRYDGTQLVPFDWSFANGGPGPGEPVDPQVGFQVQLFASTYSMALFPAIFEQSYVNHAGVWVEGSGGPDIKWIPPTERVEFYAADRGVTYVAWDSPPMDKEMIDPFSGLPYTRTYRTGIGAAMVRRAEQLWNTWQADTSNYAAQREYELYVDNLDLMRSLSAAYAVTNIGE